ncbi:MAG: formyl transferase [Proteobacteria bacterium]|nr:formyl transferase [Pseudomonadota bacterium]
MPITLLFDPIKAKRPMRVAAFMSGSGTNILRLIEREGTLKSRDGRSPFQVIFVFSDRSDGSSHGERIALDAGIPYFSYDIRSFHRSRGIPRTVATAEGLRGRREYDSIAQGLIEAFDIDVIALGGYMSFITLQGCVNVHPADLSILTAEGRRKYVGDHAVLDAISAGEQVLRSSTLWTDQGVDTGPLLMVSAALKVELPEPLDSLLDNHERLTRIADEHQERLKEVGDWQIFPQTIEMIARGRFGLDEQDNVYVDGRPVPQGYREQGS